MAKVVKTSVKRRPGPKKPLRGAIDGKPFTSTNQPPPEAKKAGWEQWRKERHLTQAIVKKMLGIDGKPTKTMNTFINKLIVNANKGNPKAIEVLSKTIEDQEAIKIALNIPLLSFDPLLQTNDTTDNSTT